MALRKNLATIKQEFLAHFDKLSQIIDGDAAAKLFSPNEPHLDFIKLKLISEYSALTKLSCALKNNDFPCSIVFQSNKITLADENASLQFLFSKASDWLEECIKHKLISNNFDKTQTEELEHVLIKKEFQKLKTAIQFSNPVEYNKMVDIAYNELVNEKKSTDRKEFLKLKKEFLQLKSQATFIDSVEYKKWVKEAYEELKNQKKSIIEKTFDQLKSQVTFTETPEYKKRVEEEYFWFKENRNVSMFFSRPLVDIESLQITNSSCLVRKNLNAKT